MSCRLRGRSRWTAPSLKRPLMPLSETQPCRLVQESIASTGKPLDFLNELFRVINPRRLGFSSHRPASSAGTVRLTISRRQLPRSHPGRHLPPRSLAAPLSHHCSPSPAQSGCVSSAPPCSPSAPPPTSRCCHPSPARRPPRWAACRTTRWGAAPTNAPRAITWWPPHGAGPACVRRASGRAACRSQ